VILTRPITAEITIAARAHCQDGRGERGNFVVSITDEQTRIHQNENKAIYLQTQDFL